MFRCVQVGVAWVVKCRAYRSECLSESVDLVTFKWRWAHGLRTITGQCSTHHDIIPVEPLSNGLGHNNFKFPSNMSHGLWSYHRRMICIYRLGKWIHIYRLGKWIHTIIMFLIYISFEQIYITFKRIHIIFVQDLRRLSTLQLNLIFWHDLCNFMQNIPNPNPHHLTWFAHNFT